MITINWRGPGWYAFKACMTAEYELCVRLSRLGPPTMSKTKMEALTKRWRYSEPFLLRDKNAFDFHRAVIEQYGEQYLAYLVRTIGQKLPKKEG